MKKLTGILALLLTLAAVFGLTGCPNPAGSGEPPIPYSITIDYETYKIPDTDIDWTKIDEDFNFASLANTTWLTPYRTDDDSGDELSIKTTYAGLSKFNADVTDYISIELVTRIIIKGNGNDFTTEEIDAQSADFEAYVTEHYSEEISEGLVTFGKITDDPTKLIFGVDIDYGSAMDNPNKPDELKNKTFQELMIMILSPYIDSTQKYMKRLNGDGDTMYQFKL